MNESNVQRAINGEDNPHIAIIEHNPMRKTINEIVMEVCNSSTNRYDKEVTLHKTILGEKDG